MSDRNIDKIMQYISAVSKHPINIDGKLLERNPNKIYISNSIFFDDGCKQCGKCCINESRIKFVYSI